VQQAFDKLDTRHRGYIAVDDLALITGGLVPEAELQKVVDQHQQ
jgi:Ca2+-binding EF-hand superfamily protein